MPLPFPGGCVDGSNALHLPRKEVNVGVVVRRWPVAFEALSAVGMCVFVGVGVGVGVGAGVGVGVGVGTNVVWVRGGGCG